MFAPYARSVVRDTAVTTQIHVATSPVRGVVDQALPVIGTRVGPKGKVLRVQNSTHQPTSAVARPLL